MTSKLIQIVNVGHFVYINKYLNQNHISLWAVRSLIPFYLQGQFFPTNFDPQRLFILKY